MTITETIFYWIGLSIAVFGGIGLLAALAVWSTNQLLEATRYGAVIMRWYFQQLRARKRRQQSGEGEP